MPDFSCTVKPEVLSGRAALDRVELAHAYPLNEFYAWRGLPLPPLAVIDGSSMPEPFRELLVHRNDMTPTLERFYGRRVHLRVLRDRRDGNDYFREVALVLDVDERPVEFGAIKIDLSLFPSEARRQILEHRLPLGRILKEHAIPHRSEPTAFIEVASDKLINWALKLSGTRRLYGRRNTLFDADDRSMAEIVEILPPSAA